MAGTVQDFPGVQVLSVMQKPTRSGRTMYDISLSNGMTASAFEAQLATKAHGFIGQGPVTARIEQTEKGYLNLKDIGAGNLNGGGFPAAAPFEAAAPAAFAQAPAPGAAMIPNANDERDKRIIRGNSLNAAAALFGPIYAGQVDTPDDVLLTRMLKFAGGFEHFIRTGQSILQAAQQAALSVPEATPQAVAEAVNQVAPGAVQVGAPVEQAVAPEQPEAAQTSAIPW